VTGKKKTRGRDRDRVRFPLRRSRACAQELLPALLRARKAFGFHGGGGDAGTKFRVRVLAGKVGEGGRRPAALRADGRRGDRRAPSQPCPLPGEERRSFGENLVGPGVAH